MLDIKFIRENPDAVKAAVKNKKAHVDVDKLLKLDEERRKLRTTIENLNQEKNEAAKNKNIEQGKLVKENLISLEDQFKILDQAYTDLMLGLPNIPSEFTPIGKDESENK